MLFRLFLLFTVVPLLELYLLIQAGTYIGALPTVGIVIVTGIIGGLLARNQGLAVLRRVRQDFQEGRLPAGTFFDGLLILIAGIVLVTPGLLTDCLGFLLLIPWTRQVFKQWLKSRLQEVDAPAPAQIYTNL